MTQKFQIGDKVKVVGYQLKGVIVNIGNIYSRDGKSRKEYVVNVGTGVPLRVFSYQLKKVSST